MQALYDIFLIVGAIGGWLFVFTGAVVCLMVYALGKADQNFDEYNDS